MRCRRRHRAPDLPDAGSPLHSRPTRPQMARRYQAPALQDRLVWLPRALGLRQGSEQLWSHAQVTACEPGNRGPSSSPAISSARGEEIRPSRRTAALVSIGGRGSSVGAAAVKRPTPLHTTDLLRAAPLCTVKPAGRRNAAGLSSCTEVLRAIAGPDRAPGRCSSLEPITAAGAATDPDDMDRG